MLSQQMLKVVGQHMRSLGTPLSDKVMSLIREGRWGDLVSLEVDPSSYETAHSYFKDISAVDFLRKMPGLPTGIDLEKAAVDTFFDCEKQCFSTNNRVKRWLGWLEDGFVSDEISDNFMFDTILMIRAEIKTILGFFPSSLEIRLGPGATFHDRGSKKTIPHKFSSRPAFTPSAECMSKYIYETAWGRSVLKELSRSAPLIVPGNRFTSVPKDAKKNRGICIEPSANLALQLAVGSLLKKRLYQNCWIDLTSSQTDHRKLASAASKSGLMATIDLSNASDTISYLLVKLLFPRMWFDLFDSLRSPKTFIQGRWVNLNKFSSMGNGFTFELETILFLALARVCAKLNGDDAVECRCYGDDIILPTASAKTLLALLSAFGFTPNAKKTFLEGRFRESCGGDFFDGIAVRPFQAKIDPDHPAAWISMANTYRARYFDSERCEWAFGSSACWQSMIDQIPKQFRVRGPVSQGDAVIHDHSLFWTVRAVNSSQREIKRLVPQRKLQSLSPFTPLVVLASALYGVPSSGAGVRGSPPGYRLEWTPIIER